MAKWKMEISYLKDGQEVKDGCVSESFDTIGKPEWKDIEEKDIQTIHITQIKEE